MAEQTVAAFDEEGGVRCVGFAEGFAHIARDLSAGTDGSPSVEVDTAVLLLVPIVAPLHERNAVRHIDGDQTGRVGGEFVKSFAFEAQGAHAEIESRVAHLHHLAGRQLISFGTCAGWHKGIDFKMRTGNVFHEIAQWLHADRDRRCRSDAVGASYTEGECSGKKQQGEGAHGRKMKREARHRANDGRLETEKMKGSEHKHTEGAEDKPHIGHSSAGEGEVVADHRRIDYDEQRKQGVLLLGIECCEEQNWNLQHGEGIEELARANLIIIR